jgi:hypothetical protein
MEIWETKAPGTLWTTPGILRDCFTINKHNKPTGIRGTYKIFRCSLLYTIHHSLTI